MEKNDPKQRHRRCFVLRKMLNIMKLTTMFFFLALFQVSAHSYAQQTRLTLKFENETLESVFGKIEQNSEFSIFYKNEQIKDSKEVSAEFKDALIFDILDQVLQTENLTYSVKDKLIMIVPKTGETNELTEQQKKSVTGKVTDTSGATLPGVSVVVKGTTLGVITDVNGKYSLSNIPENATLQFSFVGMKSQEVAVGGKTAINITLAEETIGIEEVVAVGYGTMKKINVTGSVASVSTQDIKKIQSLPVSNLTSGLTGNLPGLISVDRGGIPGANSPSISIRGFENMLIIVDGVQNSFNNIDPNEIESVSILKDASASIYGARAGNGVLLITTKRGKSQAPTINFNAYYGIQSPTRIVDMVDASTYARMINVAEIAAGRPAKYTEEEISKYKNGTDPNYPNTNWYKAVFKSSAPIAQYNLNTSGGGENVKYFVSLGYLNQGGLFRSGDLGFKKINLRSNIDAKITSSFSVSLDLALRDEYSFQPGGSVSRVFDDLYQCQPIYPAHFPDLTKLTFTGHLATQPIGRSTGSFSGYQHDDKKYLDAGLTFKYDFPFIKGLIAKAFFSSNLVYDYTKNWAQAVLLL